MENNNDVEAKESRTHSNEGIFSEVRTKNNASADQNSYTLKNTNRLRHRITKDERETNIRDLDAPEIVNFKQVQTSDQFQLKQSEEIQGRDLKKISMNIGNLSYNSCDQCD